MSQELIAKNLETIANTIHQAQSKMNELGKKVDVLETEQLKKIAESSSAALQEIQDVKAKQVAQEKAIETVTNYIANCSSAVDKNAKAESPSEKAYKTLMHKYMRNNQPIPADHPVLEEVAREIVQKSLHGLDDTQLAMQVKAMQVGSNPQGGFFVRSQVLAKMVERIFETSPVRQVASQVNTVTDAVEMIIDDNEFVSGGWVGETDTRDTTANATIGKLSIYVHEQFAQPMATQKMLDDAGFDIENWISRKTTDVMSRTENTAFVVGNGVNKPRGFLDYDAWASAGVYERGKIEQVNSGALGAFTGDGLINLQNSLIEEYQANALFMVKRASWYNIISAKDGVGQYLINPQMIYEGTDKILLGKPVIFANDIPAVGINALAAVYGDFSRGYTIVDRYGIRLLRDDLTNKPYVKFYMTKRVGGAVTNYESIKIQKLAV